jgi:2-keto-3-deoxy-L-rhamnonate aldolase RhmA
MPELILAQPSCDIAMMRAYAAAGWRNVMLDLEHSPFAEADVVSASIGLASAGASLYLKMADRNAHVCTRYLQFGVRNFLLPNVENAASVQAVWAKMSELFWVEPASIRLFPMIESRRGLREIPAVCGVEGVAGVIGPELAPTLLEGLDAIRACGKLNGSGFVRSWCKFFPMDRVDLVTLQLSDVVSVNNLDIT